jgi:hypothetical protein
VIDYFNVGRITASLHVCGATAFMLFQKAQYNAELNAKTAELAELNSLIQDLKVQSMSTVDTV